MSKLTNTINLQCSGCGWVEVNLYGVKALQCMDDNKMSVTFQCPTCTIREVLPIDTDEQFDGILAIGIPLVIWELPAREFHRNMPPISPGEVEYMSDICTDDRIWDSWIVQFFKET